MTKKNMIPALCYTTPANRDKSYLYCVGTLETIEKMMNEWNANGNPDPYYSNAGEGAIYHIEYVEDSWG